MDAIADNTTLTVAGVVTEITLRLKDISINNNINKLMDFLQQKVQGKYFLSSTVNGISLIHTCRDELLRKTDISIKSLEFDVKTDLQKLLGEYLFETLPADKQRAIIGALNNRGSNDVLIKLDVTDAETEKLLFPWEYMRCSRETLGGYGQQNAAPIWLSGQDTFFYRTLNSSKESRTRQATVNALIVDATTEQAIYKFFMPADADQAAVDRAAKFRESTSNIKFTVFGKEDSENPAVFATLIDYCQLNTPPIVHLVVDQFQMQDGNPQLAFLNPDQRSTTKIFQSFDPATLAEDLRPVIGGAAVFVLQEWKGDSSSRFEALEKAAFQLVTANVSSTVVIPYQPLLPRERDHFELMYTSLAAGNSIATALKKLRISFLNKKCYTLPVHYLSGRDFVLLEKNNSTNNAPAPASNKPAMASKSPADDNSPETVGKKRMERNLRTLASYIVERDKSSGAAKADMIVNIEDIREMIGQDYAVNKSFFDNIYDNQLQQLINKIDPDFNLSVDTLENT